MQNIEHAVKIIGEKLSLPNLALNQNGQAELKFGEQFSAYITKIDDTSMELSFWLRDLDFANPTMMKAMLEANCLGAGTGAGRPCY